MQILFYTKYCEMIQSDGLDLTVDIARLISGKDLNFEDNDCFKLSERLLKLVTDNMGQVLAKFKFDENENSVEFQCELYLSVLHSDVLGEYMQKKIALVMKHLMEKSKEERELKLSEQGVELRSAWFETLACETLLNRKYNSFLPLLEDHIQMNAVEATSLVFGMCEEMGYIQFYEAQ